MSLPQNMVAEIGQRVQIKPRRANWSRSSPIMWRGFWRHEDGGITLHEVILLDRVQKRLDIAPDEVKMLRGKSLIEGRAPNFFVAADVAAAVGDAAQYTRNKGLDKAIYKEFVISHLRSMGPTTRQGLEQLLLPMLPQVLPPQQKLNRVKNLLAEMSREKTVKSLGGGPKAVWSLVVEK